MKKVLVTGGAGYIGSHMLSLLLNQDYKVEVIDNFSTGFRSRIPLEVEVHDRSIEDSVFLSELFSTGGFDAVIHFAGLKSVEDSFTQRNRYLTNNYLATQNLVDLATKFEVSKMIFSSSAAVYGNRSTSTKFREVDLCAPVNPYGETKFLSEEYIRENSMSSSTDFVILRYFNVVGALSKDLSDSSGTNLFPQIIKSLKSNSEFRIYGGDYQTKDGSAVRDYIHVQDLVEAHLAALETNSTRAPGNPSILNLGSGSGFTVLEIAQAFEDISGLKLNKIIGPRRMGDPAEVIADTTLAEEYLNWRPRFSIRDMVYSSWISSS